MSTSRSMTPEEFEIAQRFQFHPPDTDEKKRSHEDVRQVHRDLAEWIQENVPPCREQSLALTALQESMMWANAAVAYRGTTD